MSAEHIVRCLQFCMRHESTQHMDHSCVAREHGKWSLNPSVSVDPDI
jgi:hypothetical protein